MTRLLPPVLLALLLAGIAWWWKHPGEGYPEAWPRPQTAWTGCPDLSGRYQNPDMSKVRRSLLAETGLGEKLGAEAARWPWSHVTITQDNKGALNVQWRRSMDTLREWVRASNREKHDPLSPAVRWSRDHWLLTDEDYSSGYARPVLSLRSRLALPASRYECRRGWLVSRHRVYDENGESRADGYVRLARDVEGGLVLYSGNRWERWAPDPDDDEPLPWNAPFRRDAPRPLPLVSDSAARTEEVREAIDADALPGLSVAGVEALADGAGARVTLASRDTRSFVAFFKAHKSAERFHSLEVLSLDGSPREGWRMQVQLGLRPRPSATGTDVVASWIRDLLPDGVRLDRIEPFEDGLRATLHTDEDERLGDARQALEESPRFRAVQVETHFSGAEGFDLVVRLWEGESETP
jgi:hypothetical protein